MRIFPVTGGKPGFVVARLGKDTHVALWDAGGSLGSAVLATEGSVSTRAARARWRAFLRHDPDLASMPPASVARRLSRWLDGR